MQAVPEVVITVAWKVEFVVLMPLFSLLFPVKGTDSEGARKLGSLTPPHTSFKEMSSSQAFCQAAFNTMYLSSFYNADTNK